MNHNRKEIFSKNDDGNSFTSEMVDLIKYVKAKNFKILLLFFINILFFFLIFYFFFLKENYKVSAQLDMPDSSYWEVLFSPQYQFYFNKKDPHEITTHYLKKNLLNILNDYRKNNDIDNSFNLESKFTEDDIYINLLFESQNQKDLNKFFTYFIDEINYKFNQKSITRISSFLQNQLDVTVETQMALDDIIADYELRADDFTLSQIFAYNLHSNPALIELRLKQLKAKVNNNKKLLNEYKLLSPVNVSYYSNSINDYFVFLIVLSIFALILEIVLFRFFTLLNK